MQNQGEDQGFQLQEKEEYCFGFLGVRNQRGRATHPTQRRLGQHQKRQQQRRRRRRIRIR